MDTIILSSVPGPATSVAINLELHGGSAGGAASPVTTAVSSPAAAKAMQLNSADANACGQALDWRIGVPGDSRCFGLISDVADFTPCRLRDRFCRRVCAIAAALLLAPARHSRSLRAAAAGVDLKAMLQPMTARAF